MIFFFFLDIIAEIAQRDIIYLVMLPRHPYKISFSLRDLNCVRGCNVLNTWRRALRNVWWTLKAQTALGGNGTKKKFVKELSAIVDVAFLSMHLKMRFKISWPISHRNCTKYMKLWMKIILESLTIYVENQSAWFSIFHLQNFCVTWLIFHFTVYFIKKHLDF